MENYSPGEILETVAPNPISMEKKSGSCFLPFSIYHFLPLISHNFGLAPCSRFWPCVSTSTNISQPRVWRPCLEMARRRSKYFIFHICVGAVFTSWPGYLLFLLNTAEACFLFPSRIRAQPSILIVRYLAKISDKQHSHPDTYNWQYISVNEY